MHIALFKTNERTHETLILCSIIYILHIFECQILYNEKLSEENIFLQRITKNQNQMKEQYESEST